MSISDFYMHMHTHIHAHKCTHLHTGRGRMFLLALSQQPESNRLVRWIVLDPHCGMRTPLETETVVCATPRRLPQGSGVW